MRPYLEYLCLNIDSRPMPQLRHFWNLTYSFDLNFIYHFDA